MVTERWWAWRKALSPEKVGGRRSGEALELEPGTPWAGVVAAVSMGSGGAVDGESPEQAMARTRIRRTAKDRFTGLP